jgi:two-component system cell cycle sensor histidine kinase/response regulator CckA
MTGVRILLVEDSEIDARLLARALQRAEIEPEITRVDSRERLEEALRSGCWDVCICDYRLPGMEAPEAVSIIRATGMDVPIVVVSGQVGEESAVEVMRAGAQDYLTKDRLFRLGEVVRRELSEAAVRRDRAEIERAFLASEDRLRFALEAAQMGVWDWDIQKDDMHWAPGAPQLWSMEGGLRGTLQECLRSVVAEDRDMVAQALGDAVVGARPAYALEHRVLTSDGNVHWIDVRGRVSFDEQGRAVRMAGTFLDTTGRRALESQLAHSEKMKTIGQLAGGVAHDFNNLLTVILSYCQLLDRVRPASSEITELTAPIRDAAERAAALTRQLLVFSRPQAVAPRVLDLNELIRGVNKLLVRLVGENVRVETALSGEVWPIRIDASQCEQIILNLSVNARDAMPDGGLLRIATSNVQGGDPAQPLQSDADRVLLEVTDTGEGMSEEVQRRAFEAFFTTKASGRGTGLGLATCLMVASNAGGAIHVESAIGEGTRFRVYLPRCLDQLDSVPRLDRLVRTGRLGGTVLIVEDDSLVRMTAERALRAAGYTVLGATDGEHGLRLVQAHAQEIELLFTDLVMPRLGGVELAAAARARIPRLRVLFTSGYPAEARSAREPAGGEAMLPKPYTADELTRRVNELLEAGSR